MLYRVFLASAIQRPQNHIIYAEYGDQVATLRSWSRLFYLDLSIRLCIFRVCPGT